MNDPQDTTGAQGADGAGDSQAQQHAPSPELKALEKEMRQLDGQPAAAESKQTTAIALSTTAANQRELQKAMIQVRDSLLPLMFLVNERKATMLSALWTDDAIKQIAESGGEVMTMHGISLAGFGSLGPYLGLALSLGPVAFGTYKVVTAKEPAPAEVVGG